MDLLGPSPPSRGPTASPPASSLFWKQTAVRGFSPRRSFISLTATTSPSCVVNTHQRGGLLLTKQTEEEFHFDGDLYGERQATVRSAPHNVFVTSEVDDEARKQRALINLDSNTVCLFFFPFLVFYVYTCTWKFQTAREMVQIFKVQWRTLHSHSLNGVQAGPSCISVM